MKNAQNSHFIWKRIHIHTLLKLFRITAHAQCSYICLWTPKNPFWLLSSDFVITNNIVWCESVILSYQFQLIFVFFFVAFHGGTLRIFTAVLWAKWTFFCSHLQTNTHINRRPSWFWRTALPFCINLRLCWALLSLLIAVVGFQRIMIQNRWNRVTLTLLWDKL